MSFGCNARLVLAAALLAGCGAEAKKEIAETATESMSAAQRRESFEATARLLDDNPAFVDELYSVVRGHPATMRRFLQNAAPDLREPWLAKAAADELVKHPAALEHTFVVAVDTVSGHPDARAATNHAIARRAETTVDILSDDPKALARVVEATLATVEKKPRARQNLLGAVRQQRKQLLALLRSDPELAKEVTEELVRELVKDKPTLEKALRAAGVIDEDGRSKAKR